MADISEWSGTASNNSVASPDGAATGWVGADVGPWARETMAAIQRWYKDPAWVNPTKDISPAGAKTITRLTDKSVRISAASNFTATELTYFPKGRLIRLILTGGSTKIFCIVDTATLNNGDIDLVVALLGQNTIPSGTTFASNGLEFYGPQESITTANDWQPLGATAWSGAGTTSERNTRFGTATYSELPAGILWFNTETNFIEALGPDYDNPGLQKWHAIVPYDDKWGSDGALLRVEATEETTNATARIDVITQDGGSAAIIAMSRRAQNDPSKKESLGYLQGAPAYLIAHGPAPLNVGDKSGRLVWYTGDPAIGTNGNIYYQEGVGADDGNGGVAITYAAGSSKVLTPGLVDAGTLNNLDAIDLIHRSTLVSGYKWKMSGSAFPAGDGTTLSEYVALPGVSSGFGPRVAFARFAFPPELIAELGVGNTYDMTFDFAVSSNTTANFAGNVRIAVYLGNNYGNTSTTIANYPTGGANAEFDTESTSASPSWGDGENVTAIRGTITSNYGMALAIGNRGANNTTYARIHSDVGAASGEIAMETRVIFTPVPATRYVANDFQSDAQ